MTPRTVPTISLLISLKLKHEFLVSHWLQDIMWAPGKLCFRIILPALHIKN